MFSGHAFQTSNNTVLFKKGKYFCQSGKVLNYNWYLQKYQIITALSVVSVATYQEEEDEHDAWSELRAPSVWGKTFLSFEQRKARPRPLRSTHPQYNNHRLQSVCVCLLNMLLFAHKEFLGMAQCFLLLLLFGTLPCYCPTVCSIYHNLCSFKTSDKKIISFTIFCI